MSAKCIRPHSSPKNVIEVAIEGILTLALVDTGAALSAIDARLCRKIGKVTTPLSGLSLRTANAQHIEPSGACTARVVIQEDLYVIEFIVLPSCSHDVILGWDFLATHHAIIDCARAEIELFPFSTDIIHANEDSCRKITVSEDTIIPAWSSALVSVSCASVDAGTVLFTPSELLVRRRSLPLPFAVLEFITGVSLMCVSNPSAEPITLRRRESLGRAESLASPSIFATMDDSAYLAALEESPPQSLPRSFTPSIASDLTTTQRAELLHLLQGFSSSFDCQATSLGRTTTVSHTIDTGSHAPIRQRPYRVSASERRVIDDQVNDMLKRGVIQPSSSPWASPVVLVKKKMAPYDFALIIEGLTRLLERMYTRCHV